MSIDIIRDGEAIIMIGTTEEEHDSLRRKLLNEDLYLEEMNRISNPKRMREFLMVRLLLQNFFGYTPVVLYNKEGKPRLQEPGYELSISHCGHHAAVVLHPLRKVGIDIEKRGRNVQKVARRFLSSGEKSDFAGIENTDDLLLIWSAKEALYKIIGKDACDFATSFRVYPFDTASSGVMQAEYLHTGNMYRMQYRCTDNYVLVWAIE